MFISLTIVLLVTLLYALYVWFTSSKIESLTDGKSYKYERYENYNDQTIYFVKEYYYEESDAFYENNYRYTLVKNNAEKIKKYINISLNKLNELDDTLNIEFNYDTVTSNDYYYMIEEKNVLLYYYDIDEHILYVTHFFK